MIVAPSLLSADFTNLERDVRMINESAADWIHCDVMDGIFVPNISFGFPVIKAVSKCASKPLDVHLMIVEPERYINQVRDCGAMMMNVHWEASRHLHRTVQQIHEAGMKAGVTLNPSTPVKFLRDIVCDVDMVLLMSVNPGFGGQSFIGQTIDKIKRLRKLMTETGSSALIQIDGGINLQTGKLCKEAGADVLVAGNNVFTAADPKNMISQLAQL